MDPSIAKKKVKRRRAPPPPNPFTGEVEQTLPPVTDDEEEDVRWLFWLYNKIIIKYCNGAKGCLAGPFGRTIVRACMCRKDECMFDAPV